MQIETTLRYHLISTRIVIMNKSENCQRECGCQGALLHCCQGVQINTAIVKISLDMPQKPKIKLSYDLTILLLGTYPGNTTPYHRHIYIPMLLLLYSLWQRIEINLVVHQKICR